MGKIGGIIIDIVLALVIIFLAVTIYFGLRMESVMKTLGSEITDDFVDNAKKNGYFTPEDYEAFIHKISLTDVLYDVNLEHVYTIYEPEYRFRSLQEVLDEQNNSYTGTNMYTYVPVSTIKPGVSDPVNNGSLNTETNESVLASAVNTPSSPGHIHTEVCYKGHRHTPECNIESYYTGAPLNLFKYTTSESNYMNINYKYQNLECTTCGYELFTFRLSSASINHPYATDVGINVYQSYLDRNNVIKQKNVYEARRYLVSYTDPNDSSWFHFNDTITVNGYPQEINNWRKERGDWYLNYESNTYFNWIYWDNDYYVTDKTVPYRLGFQDKYSCPSCMQNGTIAKTLVEDSSCGQIQDETMDCSTNVTSITATHPVQTVATNDPIITTVRATYLDGSTKVVLASATFSTANVVQNQTVTLTYTYNIDGITYTKTNDITITVIPRSKTCVNGHTYQMNSNGSDPGCPYCKAWVSSINFIHPTSTPFVITIGTTLQENGLKLLVTYLDGHSETLTSGYADNLDKRYLGSQLVTVGYKGAATTLRVTTIRAKITCTICGYVYDLYPDGTDPGCPKCLKKIPVFTGNIMTHDNAEYTEHILEHLYQKGSYEFNQGDKIVVKIRNRSTSLGRKVLSMIFPSLSKHWFSYINEETIKMN